MRRLDCEGNVAQRAFQTLTLKVSSEISNRARVPRNGTGNPRHRYKGDKCYKSRAQPRATQREGRE